LEVTSTDHSRETYQSRIRIGRLIGFSVRVKETDLHVQAKSLLVNQTCESILRHRGYIETLIHEHPEFATTLKPWVSSEPHPGVIRDMISAGITAGVGPMAAVAGAVAQRVAQDLSVYSDELIIENGGDIFIRTNDQVTVAVYAANSPFSMKTGIILNPLKGSIAVCTSSGTVGHSLSFGRADAVSVVSENCALADAAATAIANRVRNKKDIDSALEEGAKIEGVKGIVIIIGKTAGFWGDVQLVPIH
jgi:uncharacterized protein